MLQAAGFWVWQQMLYKDETKHRTVRMYTTKKKGWRLLCFLFVSCGISLSSSQNVQFAGVQIQMRIAVVGSAEQISDVHKNAIAGFFAAQTQLSCSPLSCPLTPATDVVFEPIANGVLTDAATNTHNFDITMSIRLPDNSRALAVKTSSNNALVTYGLSMPKLNSNLLLEPSLGLSISTYDVAYTRDAARPLVCGDSRVTGDEVCDDGNTIDGDGCSSVCTLEAGFTCFGAMRTEAAARGKMTAWETDAVTGVKTLVVSVVDEFCTRDNICVQHAVAWDPVFWWTTAYSTGVIPQASLAPAGFYCKSFCTQTFDAAQYYEFANSCVPTGKDECSRGTSTCDVNAYCTEPEGQVGFACECDEKYFVSVLDGVACATAGVEVVFLMGGTAVTPGDDAATDAQNRLNMVEARQIVIDALFTQGYLKPVSSAALLLEGVKKYPIEMVKAVVEEPLSPLLGRSLWRIVLRAPDIHLDLTKMAGGSIFDNAAGWQTLFADTAKYRINEVGVCSNDRARSCTPADVTCLNGGTCVANRADFNVRKLDAGGLTAPLQLDSSGLEVLSVDYDITQMAFSVRMRYNDEAVGVIDAVFVSHMGANQDPLMLPTFRSDEFPCLPLGTKLFQNQRDNSVCCLDRFYDHYTTIQDFGDYISDATKPLQMAIAGQGACSRLDEPPSNFTTELLNTNRNFVNGSFARMVRSHSRIDPTPSRGYQDILLYLALEDVQNLAALRTPLESPTGLGDRLRFFVGMAHIKTLRSNRLAVSSSQVEINADITTSYVYTTKTSTDFTFIRDVSVQLREVRRSGTPVNSSTAKFATITIIVPETLSAIDPMTIIPPLSLQVSVGYSQNVVTYTAYPCEDTYKGDTKNTIDTLLQTQRSCALQDPICSAQGPVAVGPGGSIQFTFPLDDSVWSIADLADDSALRKSLFIDFMVAVVDQNGKKLVTNLKTSTVLQRTSILTMCTDLVEIESSIEELLTLDVFLGMVGLDEDFDSALVKNEDVTRQTSTANMRRDISSKASNVMTLLIKGDAATFDEPYATEYTLAVEDIITLHFLSSDKLAAVQAHIDAGTAFTQVRNLPGELSIMKLMPTDALLALCPIQAIAGRYGCITRREVTQRDINARSTSVINIAPNDASDLNNVSTRAGVWASNLLGNTEYARQLGFNHSTIMNQRYNLNARYRRGFVISPTTPWRQREMDVAGIDSPLDLSQITITTMLISIDANINRLYRSTVPGGAPRPGATARRLLSMDEPSISQRVSRMLLTFDGTASASAPSTGKPQQSAPTTTREITSVHDNDNVVQAVCSDRPDATKCGMIRLTKTVSMAEFCQSEEAVILKMQAGIKQALQSASKNALAAMHVTTVSQRNRDQICRPQVRRRMLATTADLVFTLVLEVAAIRDRYVFDQKLLATHMITAITSLTNATYFSLCGGGGMTDEACAEKIADQLVPVPTRDIVLHFSVHNPTPAIPLNHVLFQSIIRNVYGTDTKVVMSTPVHVMGHSTEFHVTISVPFLKVYNDDIVTMAKNNLFTGNFLLEEIVHHEFELDMARADVTTAVQMQVQQTVATQYGLGPGKVKVTVHDAGVVLTGKTKIDVAVRTLRKQAVTHAAGARAMQEHKMEMASKIDAAFVTAMYKKVVLPKSDTATGATASDSNDRLYIWLLLAFLLICGIAFVIFARQKLKSPVDYTSMQQVPVVLPLPTSNANPYWHPHGAWHH